MKKNVRIGIQLAATPYGKVREVKYDLAVLPWGATEPHNLHLPYLTDCILSEAVALDAAQWTGEKTGAKIMVLPPVAMGSQNPGQRDLSFCIHSRYETQKAILTDIVSSLYHQGMRRMVIVNGHGGNCFKNMIRDLAVDYPDFLIFSTEWFTIVPPSGFFDEKDDHAGELETSVMMYYHPELVNLADAGAGKAKPFALSALNEKIAWVPRDWMKVTEDTGIGDPRKASAEKGRQYVILVVEKLSRLFTELSSQQSVY